jgi:hypothetical protein
VTHACNPSYLGGGKGPGTSEDTGSAVWPAWNSGLLGWIRGAGSEGCFPGKVQNGGWEVREGQQGAWPRPCCGFAGVRDTLGGDVRWALVSGQLSLNILCSLGQRGDLGLLRQAGFVSRPSTGTPARSARGIPQK